ncbi:hypothetical protein CLU79DRAFT_779603 [Phycomyces nitens]|nr:hypothetical protein CLU79DRAFT_779603 [Phycomyces nitens]
MELEQSLGQLFDHPSQLRLVNAAEQIRLSTNAEMTLSALTFLRLKAMQQDTEAKTKLSTIYAEGQKDVIEKDQDEADMWSRSVFDKQLNQALALSTDDLITIGKQQPTNLALSTIGLIMTGAEQGVPTLCYLAGLMLTKGIGHTPDIDQGLAFLERAGEQKQPDAAYELGRFYSDRYHYSRPDLKQSLYWYQRAFENGDTRALVDLAYGFSEGDLGHDVPRDDDRAFRYAEQGAKTDDKYCQYILGHLYLKGRGVAQDSEKAVYWLSASADQGFAVALEEISAIYLKGHGDVPKDYRLAHEWCLKGVSTTAYCQTSLGDIYRNGWGVQRDYQKAFQYYQTAAIQPDSPHHYAQHMLGEM